MAVDGRAKQAVFQPKVGYTLDDACEDVLAGHVQQGR